MRPIITKVLKFERDYKEEKDTTNRKRQVGGKGEK